jgi:hypothetical protein
MSLIRAWLQLIAHHCFLTTTNMGFDANGTVEVVRPWFRTRDPIGFMDFASDRK